MHVGRHACMPRYICMHAYVYVYMQVYVCMHVCMYPPFWVNYPPTPLSSLWCGVVVVRCGFQV